MCNTPPVNDLRAQIARRAEEESAVQSMRFVPPSIAELSADSAEMLSLAVEIADETARTNVELHAAEWHDLVGMRWWNTQFLTDADAELHNAVARDLRYLTLRGHVLRNPAMPYLVQFGRFLSGG